MRKSSLGANELLHNNGVTTCLRPWVCNETWTQVVEMKAPTPCGISARDLCARKVCPPVYRCSHSSALSGFIGLDWKHVRGKTYVEMHNESLPHEVN